MSQTAALAQGNGLKHQQLPLRDHTSIDAESFAPSPLRRVFVGSDGLRSGWSLALFLTVFCLLLLLFGIDPRQFFSTEPRPAAARAISLVETTLNEGVLILCVLASTFLMSRLERRPMRAYGLGYTPRILPQLFSGLAWGVVFLSLLVTILDLTHLLVFTSRLLSGASVLRFAMEWFAAFLLVALFEEYGLRGYLQFTLARGLAGTLRAAGSPFATTIGFWIAAILLSFVFSLGHRTNPGESPLGLLSAGLIGLVFCLSLWRTGSLWWALGFHAAWDWAQSFVYGVADSGTMIRFHLLASHPQGKPLLSGGLTGPEGSLLILPTTALIALAILLTLRHTGWPMPGSYIPSLDLNQDDRSLAGSRDASVSTLPLP